MGLEKPNKGWNESLLRLERAGSGALTLEGGALSDRSEDSGEPLLQSYVGSQFVLEVTTTEPTC